MMIDQPLQDGRLRSPGSRVGPAGKVALSKLDQGVAEQISGSRL